MRRGAQFSDELERLILESTIVFERIVLPGWGGSTHGMPDTLYGYVMGAFGRIDLYSAHWLGSTNGNQTVRMLNFMTKYLRPRPLENSIAVQVWRHKLMHTASPRELLSTETGQTYRWLLHWGDLHLPRSQHFEFQERQPILNMSLAGLLADLKEGLTKYMSDLNVDLGLQKNYDSMSSAISLSEYKKS